MMTTEKRCHPERHARSKFTLIELLVVIVIIAVLTGMLLPAFNKVKETGREIQCVGNSSGICRAVMLYSDSYHSFLPSPYWAYGGSSETPNWEMLTGFAGEFNMKFDPDTSTNKKTFLPHSPFQCPSHETFGMNAIKTSYGINTCSDSSSTTNLTRLLHLRQPSRICLISENNGHSMITAKPNEVYSITTHHPANYIVSFAGGHTERRAGRLVPCIETYPGWALYMSQYTYFWTDNSANYTPSLYGL